MTRPEKLVRALAGTAVIVGGLCVVLHLVAAVTPGHGSTLTRGVLFAMAVLCVPCVRALSRGPTSDVWAMTGLMYAGMLGAHLLLLEGPWSAMSANEMHAEMGSGVGWTQVGMWAGLTLAGVQVVLASAALTIKSSMNDGIARPRSTAGSSSEPSGATAVQGGE